MLRAGILALVFSGLLSSPSWAQSAETWTPTSDNAMSLGKVRFTPTRISMKGGVSLDIQATGTVPYQTDWGPTVTATVYKVIKLTNPRRTETFCGPAKIAYLLISRPPPVGSDISPREVDAFRGPNFGQDSRDYCGRTSFDAGKR